MSVSSIEQTFSTATQLSNHVQDALAILGVSWWVACTGIDVKSKTVSDDSGPQQSEDSESCERFEKRGVVGLPKGLALVKIVEEAEEMWPRGGSNPPGRRTSRSGAAARRRADPGRGPEPAAAVAAA
jgi:hypothetical protein